MRESTTRSAPHSAPLTLVIGVNLGAYRRKGSACPGLPGVRRQVCRAWRAWRASFQITLGRMLSWPLGREQFHFSIQRNIIAQRLPTTSRFKGEFHLRVIHGVARNSPHHLEAYSASNVKIVTRSVRNPPSLSFIHQPLSAPPWRRDNHGRTSSCVDDVNGMLVSRLRSLHARRLLPSIIHV